jgi:hypothetical protein
MNILITGSRELSHSIAEKLNGSHNVRMVSKSNGYDIDVVDEWANDFFDYDWLINCAYSNFSQVNVLEEFAKMWGDDINKKILNIGSMVTDYTRSERDIDFKYFPYRIHKQALQLAFNRLAKDSKCDIKLINSGPFESAMTKSLKVTKFTQDEIASRIIDVLKNNHIKRVDLWK